MPPDIEHLLHGLSIVAGFVILSVIYIWWLLAFARAIRDLWRDLFNRVRRGGKAVGAWRWQEPPKAAAAAAAAVPLYVVNDPLFQSDPNILEARPADIIEVLEHEYEQAKAAGLRGHELEMHMAGLLSGCGRKPASGSKAKQQAGRGWLRSSGGGVAWVRGGVGRVEGWSGWARLGWRG